MNRPGPAVAAVLALGVAVVLAAAVPSSASTQRPFIALVHSAQSVIPHTFTQDNMTAFFTLDTRTRELCFTASEGDVQLVFNIVGPAAPGELGGAVVATGVWEPGPITVGPLTKSQVKALRHGRLYIEFTEPSAIPEPPRAMRGQILPIPGIRY